MMIKCGWLMAGLLLPGTTPGWAAEIDFGREIRPILSKNCYACHGPDEKKRKAKLRLDTREGALAERGFSSPDVAAVLGGNALRVLAAVLP